MKSLIFLGFLFFAIPGSGQLVWDGIPFSTRAEFAGIVILLIVAFTRRIREHLSESLSHFRWKGLLKPLLVILCVAKLFTFALMPLGAGFGACYRSIYVPLEDPLACEKSFEAPFIQEHGLPEARVSRVDAVVDFGKQMYDWRLPHMNEFHRFPVLWLTRFPFSVTYQALVDNPTSEDTYLPIRGVGELQVRVDGNDITTVENYERYFLTAIQLPTGKSHLKVAYRYTDDNATELPDSAPTERGPYAELKIGKTETVSQLLSKSKLLIFGREDSGDSRGSIEQFYMYDRYGQEVQISKGDVGDVGDGSHSASAKKDVLAMEVSAEALTRAPLKIVGTIGENSQELAVVHFLQSRTLDARLVNSPSAGRNFSAVLTIDAHELVPLTPGPISDSGLLFALILRILDLVSLLTLGMLTIAAVRTLGANLFWAILIASVAWIAVNPFYAVLPTVLGGGRELVVPYAIIAVSIIAARKQISHAPFAFLLPVSAVIGAQKVFDHVYYNHPGEGADWWGKLIFLWRDSDWYVNHGNARAVFTESFFQGGESVYYARTGPRYLIFFGQFLFGENDILIGLMSVSAGFLVLFVLATRFSAAHESRSSTIAALAVTYLGMVLISDQIITAFGFLVTSEYTAWIGILGTTAYLAINKPEQRLWLSTTISALIAVIVHFRPNVVFVCVALFFIVLSRIDRTDAELMGRQVAWAVTAMTAVLPIALIHNLYFGGRFVPFTENNASTVSVHKNFYWTKVWSELGVSEATEVIWKQFRTLMYWGPPGDPNLAIGFWGSQVLWVVSLALLLKHRQLTTRRILIALLPLTYVVPMLSYKLTSYYPRHVVAASLLCLCSALLIWPKAVTSAQGSESSMAAT